jgi:KipI family sensor histidine kinase inhibitor
VAPRFVAAADTAMVVELGDAVSEDAAAAVRDLDARLAAAPPAGMVEVIPALRSLLVEYDPLRTSHARLRGDVEALMRADAPGLQRPEAPASPALPADAATHSVDVCYEGEDLAAVARASGLDVDEVVRLHSAATYRVAMVGNLPGLPYLLGLDDRLAMPRRLDPRDAVPAGSVAIAGALSCVYPAAGPGGWHLIGHTDAVLFDAGRVPPALVQPGDTVRFVARDRVVRVSTQASPAGDGGARDGAGPHLRVVEPGLLTTVHDGGRHGHQRIGVPVGGAMDGELLRVANLLAGNAPGDAALEVTHSGPLLEVRAHSARIAVAGDVELTRIGVDGRSTPADPWRSMVLRKGERLGIGRVHGGLRCIVAVEGGIGVEPVLGSRSTCLRSGFGGLQGRALRGGDALPLQRAYAGHHPDVRLDAATLHDAGLHAHTGGEQTSPIRVVPGPQQEACTVESVEALLHTALSVSHRSDRVGLRLDGIRMQHRGPPEIISDGCAHGSVQVPGSGQPIVLLADRGTTGGYPKVATVASVDLPRLARLRPGDRLRFEAVDVAEAERLRRQREVQMRALAEMLATVPG